MFVPGVCVCVWAQVSLKLLNLKGLCVDYVCFLFLIYKPLCYQRICTSSFFLLVCIQEF